MKQHLILLLLISSIHSFAQKTIIKWDKTEKFNYRNDCLGSQKGLLYTLKSSSVYPLKLKEMRIDVYDENNFIVKNTIEFSSALKTIKGNEFLAVYLLDDRIAVFSKNSRRMLIGSILGLDGNIIKEQVALDTNRVYPMGKEGTLNIALTEDRKAFVTYKEIESKPKKEEHIYFKVFNPDLEKINNYQLKLPYSFQTFSIDLLFFNDNENFLLRGTAKEKEKKEEIITDVMLGINMKTNEAVEIKLPFDITKINKVLMSVSESGDIQFYTLQDREGQVGIAYARIDKGGMVVDNKFYPVKKETGITSNYEIRKVYASSEGLFVLLEDESLFSVPMGSRDGIMIYAEYKRLRNIVVARLDPENGIDWTTTINKNQVMILGGFESDRLSFISFTPFMSAHNLYLFYTDHPDNFSNNNPREFNYLDFKQAQCVMVTINKTSGELTKKVLMKNADNETLLLPNASFQVNANTLFLHGGWYSILFKRNIVPQMQKFGVIKFD